MAKVVVAMGYKSFILDSKDGIALMDVLAKAEVYEESYHGAVEGQPSYHTYHVYPLDTSSSVTMRLVSDDAYKMYKMAGKPQ